MPTTNEIRRFYVEETFSLLGICNVGSTHGFEFRDVFGFQMYVALSKGVVRVGNIRASADFTIRVLRRQGL